jgi:Arc/MetJ-type ribon-helix-helix transcriptional regulator
MSKTTRVQIDMPTQSLERLQLLKTKTEATSYSEVLRTALRLFEFAVDQTAAGGRLFIRRPDGEEAVLLGPVFP